MQIRDLELLNFRNYHKLSLSFNPRLNIIIGNNGVGKTNLVEAIYSLALTKSFRSNDNALLIKKKKKKAKIVGTIEDLYLDKYEVDFSIDGKIVYINQVKINRLSEYISKINVVVFNPNDLKIIKDTPSIRRKLLNVEISQLNSLYLRKMQDYNKVLKQRNAYLKLFNSRSTNYRDYLDILTEQLIDLGLEIFKMRDDFINHINEKVSSIYYNITGLDNFYLKYISSFKGNREDIKKMYDKNLERDILFGKTNIGIHHDDIDFLLDKDSLKEYGSQGQQKNAIISLKLAEIEVFFNAKKTKPILIFDDLFSELDNEKLNNILKMLPKDIQTFITTTDIANIKESMLHDCKIFRINNSDFIEVNEVKK